MYKSKNTRSLCIKQIRETYAFTLKNIFDFRKNENGINCFSGIFFTVKRFLVDGTRNGSCQGLEKYFHMDTRIKRFFNTVVCFIKSQLQYQGLRMAAQTSA